MTACSWRTLKINDNISRIRGERKEGKVSVTLAEKTDAATDVIDHIKNEIDSITIDGVAEYEPNAWTREGRVD